MCNKGVTDGYLSSNKCALPLYGYVALLKFSACIDGGPRSARTTLGPTTSRSRKNISNTRDQSQLEKTWLCEQKEVSAHDYYICPELTSPTLILLYCLKHHCKERERISCLDLQFMWITRNQVALGFLYLTICYVQWRWRYLYDLNICPPFQTYKTDGWFG